MSQNYHLSGLSISIESIAWRLVVSDLHFKARLRFYGNLVGTRSKTLQVPRKKTVTFNDSILFIYCSNVNDFKALSHAFPSRWFNPTFACPWRAENVPFPGRKMNRIDFLTVATNFRFLFDFYWHSLLMITQFFGKIINDGFFLNHAQMAFKVTRPSYFLKVPSYFDALWYPTFTLIISLTRNP